MRRYLALLCLSLPVALSACGAEVEPTEGAIYQRLPLASPVPIPARETIVHARLEPSAEGLGDWRATAPSVAVERFSELVGQASDGQTPTELYAVSLLGSGRKTLSVPCATEVGDFNAVRVHIRSVGDVPTRARIQLRSGGMGVQVAPGERIWAEDGRVAMTAEFPQLRRWKVKVDEIEIELRGESKGASISAVELLRVPLADFLPATEGLGELVSLGRDFRRAVGLSSRHPLVARFRVPENSLLHFSYGLQQPLRVPRERSELRVTLAAAGGTPRYETFPLETEITQLPGWHEASLNLDRHAGDELEVTFELAAQGDHEALALVGELALTRSATSAPTVLLITSDTHRGDHVGQYSEESPVRTPNLDALGDRGVFFSRAHSTINTTNPSHVAMMTALSPRDTRILDNHTPLLDRARTLAERFAELGYRTMAAVSTGHLLHDTSGLGQGFDRIDGPLAGQRRGDLTVDVLGRWIEATEGQPLFLWLHLFDAHIPYEPPPPYDRRYWDGGDPFAEDGGAPPPVRVVIERFKGLTEREFPHCQYRAEVDFVDEQVGRVLELPRIRSGIVAFTADHGESFGEHGIWWDHAGLYPQTTAVPLILSWPDGPRGLRCEAPVSHLDLGRTLLDLAGHESVEFPGRDLRRMLEESPRTEPLFEISAGGCSAAIQTERHRLVMHLLEYRKPSMVKRRWKHEVELYDVLADPRCEVNLVREEDHYPVARSMRALLIRWLEGAERGGLAADAVNSEELMKNLEALGYTQGGGTAASRVLYEEDPQNEWCRFFAR